MFLSPEDFYYLNDKGKIYAYVHKTTEICTPDHTPGYYKVVLFASNNTTQQTQWTLQPQATAARAKIKLVSFF